MQEHKMSKTEDYHPPLDNDGLISPGDQSQEQGAKKQEQAENHIVVKTMPAKNKSDSLEKLQHGFNKLIDQLQGINENLNRQITQHEDLMNRMEKMPELLESFPKVVENQNRLTEQLLEELKTTSTKNQQFIDTVEKIPAETVKQTDALVDINHQLAAAADADVQMAESFNKFNKTIEKLDQSTVGQTDGILQMSKTFATSDRYLKYIITRQNKRFMWMFITSLSVSLLVILIFTGIIIYLKQQ